RCICPLSRRVAHGAMRYLNACAQSRRNALRREPETVRQGRGGPPADLTDDFMTFSENARHGAPRRLELGALLAFSVAGFLAIMTENMPAGLLPQIGDALGVSAAQAG